MRFRTLTGTYVGSLSSETLRRSFVRLVVVLVRYVVLVVVAVIL